MRVSRCFRGHPQCPIAEDMVPTATCHAFSSPLEASPSVARMATVTAKNLRRAAVAKARKAVQHVHDACQGITIGNEAAG